MLFRYLFILYAMLLVLDATAQWPSDEQLQRRTVTDGLSDNSISFMAEDSLGFVWMATANGLNRFNGNKVTSFYSSNNQLPSGRIFMVKNMPRSRLLIGTEEGVMVMHTRTGITQKITLPAKENLKGPANEAERVFCTPDEKIIVASKTGVYVTDTSGKIYAALDAGFRSEDVARRRIYFVLNMDMFTNGDALISTTRGYYFYHHAAMSFERLDTSSRAQLQSFRRFIASRSNSYIFNINRHDQLFFIDFKSSVSDTLFVFDTKKDLQYQLPLGFQPNTNIRWDAIIGFHNDSSITITANRNGLFHAVLDPRNMRWVQQPERSLISYNVRHVLHTSNNRWVLGTETGLLIESYWKRNIKVQDLGRYLQAKGPQAVASYLEHDGKKWMGFNSNEQGLVVLDSMGRMLKNITVSSQLNAYDRNKFRFLQPWSKDTILAGTAVGLFLINARNYAVTFFGASRNIGSFPPIRVTAMYRDQRQTWWISLAGNGVWNYNPRTEMVRHYKPGHDDGNLPLTNVHAFAEDKDGHIWMVQQREGLVRWNYNTQVFDEVIRSWPGWPSGKFDCTGIATHPDGSLWCFINGKGLYQFHPGKSLFHPVALLNDRSEDEVKSLVVDSDGMLWLNLRHGVSVYDTAKHQLYQIGMEQGLPGPYNTGYDLYFDSIKSMMYAGFANHVAAIPQPDPSMNKMLRGPYVTGISLLENGNLLDHTSSFSLRHDQNSLRVDVDRIQFDTERAVSLEYRLVFNDHSAEWIHLGDQQTIYLSNLSPGSYRFELRPAMMASQSLDTTATANFTIHPAFTQTIPFRILLLMLGLGVVYAIYRMRLRQALRMQALRHAISGDLHDDIGSRLTQIRFLNVLAKQKIDDPTEANRLLAKMEDEIKQSGDALDEIVWSMKAVEVDGATMAARMRRYADHFFEDDTIAFTMLSDQELEKLILTPEQRKDIFLVFREMLSNVRKHAKATEVEAILRYTDHSLMLSVSDNGVGLDSAAKMDRNGLELMKLRLSKWGGTVLISKNEPQGTVIKVIMPIPRSSPLKVIFSA